MHRTAPAARRLAAGSPTCEQQAGRECRDGEGRQPGGERRTARIRRAGDRDRCHGIGRRAGIGRDGDDHELGLTFGDGVGLRVAAARGLHRIPAFLRDGRVVLSTDGRVVVAIWTERAGRVVAERTRAERRRHVGRELRPIGNRAEVGAAALEAIEPSGRDDGGRHPAAFVARRRHERAEDEDRVAVAFLAGDIEIDQLVTVTGGGGQLAASEMALEPILPGTIDSANANTAAVAILAAASTQRPIPFSLVSEALASGAWDVRGSTLCRPEWHDSAPGRPVRNSEASPSGRTLGSLA